MDGFLSKPLERDDLFQTIASLIDQNLGDPKANTQNENAL